MERASTTSMDTIGRWFGWPIDGGESGSEWAPDGIAVGYDEQEKNWSAEISGERYGAVIEGASFVG